ncbi:Auxin-responsive protein [Nymphaea thermarum]|nr:Auxin-responsive protein [Nymphaea thermarum]
MEREDEEKSGRAPFHLGLGVRDGRKHEGVGGLEEKDLGPKTRETELRLALPGGDWPEGRQIHLPEYPCDNLHSKSSTNSVGVKRMFSDTVDGFSTKEGSIHNLVAWSSSTPLSLTVLPSNQTALLHFEQKTAVPSMAKEPPPVAMQLELKNTNTAASEQRVVVGWPPLRSFRKNFASSSGKRSGEIESSGASVKETKAESCKQGLFVKINMDGVPIGRKIDLGAYDSYKKLSVAVDELFRALLAAQRDTMSAAKDGSGEKKPITGLLDGSGDYTLVYEDDEGDRMLAGDVPWGMFVKSVKRLRVLKSSDLSGLLVPPSGSSEAKAEMKQVARGHVLV